MKICRAKNMARLSPYNSGFCQEADARSARRFWIQTLTASNFVVLNKLVLRGELFQLFLKFRGGDTD